MNLQLIPQQRTDIGYRKCDQEDCYGDARASGAAKGLCAGHYKQSKRHGSVQSEVRRQVGLTPQAISISDRSLFALTSLANERGESVYQILREVILSELPRYEDLKGGLPDRVAIRRGESSNIVKTALDIETLVRVVNIGRKSGNKSRGYVCQQIVERFALSQRKP